MLLLVEALRFRCLEYIHQPLNPFQVLVGPNASGKTTFLDVVAFLVDLLSKGLDEAIVARTSNFRDLLFFQQGQSFELALELAIPEERRSLLAEPEYDRVRYEVAIGIKEELEEVHILDEQVLLKTHRQEEPRQRSLFPAPPGPPLSIMTAKSLQGARRAVRKVYGGNDNFYPEVKLHKGWAPSYRLGPRKSALANLPDDETNFPVSTWLRQTLVDGTQSLMLNSLVLRQSSRPGQGKLLRPDGSNLPWVIQALRDEAPERFQEWIAHLRTALPDLMDVETELIPDIRHRYLRLLYEGGLRVPSWMASDGTLRMLALTLPAYLTNFKGIYLIEEPENGIHPMAMETVYQSLSSVYAAQILLATHSPVVLGCARPEDVICFKKNDRGATDTVLGSEHPALKGWQGEVSLSVLFASGVLG